MDHLPAQATFVEITFAVNLLFAAYRDFRDFLKEHLAKKVEEFEATIKTLEISLDRLDTLNTIVRQYARAFENAQQICVCVATVVSLVAAAGCVAVVFWDWLTILGHHTGWLFLPLPVYFLASGCNYAVFRVRGNRMLRRFRNYSSEFDPPQLPVVPQVSTLRRVYLACLWTQSVFWILCGLALAGLYVSGFFGTTLNQQWLLLMASTVVFPVSALLSIVILSVFIRERFFAKENDPADRPSFLGALPSAIFLAAMIFVVWRSYSHRPNALSGISVAPYARLLTHELRNYMRPTQEAGFVAQGAVHSRIDRLRADAWLPPSTSPDCRLRTNSDTGTA